MGRLLRTLVRRGLRLGWRRGVLGGNRSWVVVGGLALLGHLAGRAFGREEDVVVRERISPGEAFEVRHLPRDR